MSQKEKRVRRLLTRPKDMRPLELVRILKDRGYKTRTVGSHCQCTRPGCRPFTVPLNVPTLKVSYIVDAIRFLGLEEETDEGK